MAPDRPRDPRCPEPGSPLWTGAETEPRRRHERPVPPGGPGRLPGRPEGGHAEGSERPGRGRDDSDLMGRLPRKPGGAPAHRGQRVSPRPEPNRTGGGSHLDQNRTNIKLQLNEQQVPLKQIN